MQGTMETMSLSDQQMYRRFEMPMDVKHDLVYCQQALANHIFVHQEIAMAAAQLNIPNFRAKKSLSQMEKEIIGIGADQKWVFNRLRLFIDYFLLRNKVDRKQLTDYVSELISMYAKVCGEDIRPMRVQRRLCAAELYAKFFANNSMNNVGPEQLSRSQHKNSEISLLDDDDCDDGIASKGDDDDMKGEVMEFLMSPADISEPTVSNESANRSLERERKSLTKQQSLLKPKEERISLPKDEKTQKPTSPQLEAINLSRMKLKEALCKAKDKKGESKELQVKAKSVSPEQMRSLSNESKPIAALSSSQSSSSSSSEDIYEPVGNSYDAVDSNAVDKETFMRLFGLCTHSYSQYMSRRHTKRKRNCTSTERGEYHYGRLDLFEKQYANKRNKRQFLYSPPATRAKKQRRAGSDAEANSLAITNAAGSVATARGSKSNVLSSSGPISSKVCVTCFKRNNLLECKLCQGKYHASCHIRLAHASCRNNICPCCWRQKNRQYQQQQVQRKMQRAYHNNQISVK